MSRRVTSSQINAKMSRPSSLAQPEMLEMVKQRGIKAAAIGAIFAAAGAYLYGSDNVNFLGMRVSGPVSFFLTGAAASAVADVAHDWYDPNKPRGADKLSDMKSLAVGGAIAGAAVVGISKLTDDNLPMEAVLPAFGLGAGAYVVGDALEGKFAGALGWE